MIDDSAMGPGDSPGFLMWRATLRWQRAMATAVAPHGLTHVQFVLLTSLWWLSRDGSLPTQRELADHTGTDVMTTSQVLRALEAKRLVTRSADPADARVRRLAPTPAGAEVVAAARADVEAADAQFFAAAADGAGLLRELRALAAWETGGGRR